MPKVRKKIKATKMEMAIDLTKTAYSAILRKKMRETLCVSEDEAEERLMICKECPSFREKDKRCIECGCFMLIKVKLKGVECPLSKW